MILNSCSSRMMVVSKLTPPTTITNKTWIALKPLRYSNNSSSSSSSQSIDTDSLRTQLDQLYSEADTTRSKVNNARMRLMRLSEAAENLQKRAAIDVQVGKETEARDLLVQKKKLMNALEKSKQRIDVLDKLATKINEAISLKEAQLIGNVSMYPEFNQEESHQPIWFVNPKVDQHEDPNKTDVLDQDCIKTVQSEKNETENYEDCIKTVQSENETENYEKSLLVDCDTLNNVRVTSRFDGISSFEEFLQSVDRKLQQVESDLVIFLRLSTLILESDKKKVNAKVQQTSAILEDISSTRTRGGTEFIDKPNNMNEKKLQTSSRQLQMAGITRTLEENLLYGTLEMIYFFLENSQSSLKGTNRLSLYSSKFPAPERNVPTSNKKFITSNNGLRC